MSQDFTKFLACSNFRATNYLTFVQYIENFDYFRHNNHNFGLIWMSTLNITRYSQMNNWLFLLNSNFFYTFFLTLDMNSSFCSFLLTLLCLFTEVLKVFDTLFWNQEIVTRREIQIVDAHGRQKQRIFGQISKVQWLHINSY